MSAKSVFERRLSEAATAAAESSSVADRRSSASSASPVKRLDGARKFAEALVDQQR